jgi:hypothetical protein
MASGRVLDFKQAIGGSDQVINLEMLPEQTQTFTYQFGQDVSTYSFVLDYMAVVVDSLTYVQANGAPNYASTNVIGYLGNIDGAGNTTVTANASVYIDTTDAANGNVVVTIPPNRVQSDGYIKPNARTNVVITVAEFSWNDGAATNPAVDSHRYSIVERFSPNATPGDPTDSQNPASFVSL